MSFINKIIANLKAIWKRQPARITSVIVSVVIFVCAKVGIVVPAVAITEAIAYVLPVLFGGEIIRANVTPSA